MMEDGPLAGLAGRVGALRRRLEPVEERLTPLDGWLADLRADRRRRRLALVGGVVVGLALAWVHGVGLVAGGALVGLTRRTVGRAVLAGLAFGLLATTAGVLLTPTIGPGAFAGLTRLGGITTAVGVLASVWGSLLRAAL
jgi:tetrahydromethanopterin S-methyltransferase subunit G